MRVISIYPNFSNRGGAQNVCSQLASALNGHSQGIILTNTTISDIPREYTDREGVKFKRFTFFSVLKYMSPDTVFLSHHRKTTTMLVLMKCLWRKKLNVVHVAHNTFSSLRLFSLFPRYIISVSEGVKDNLIKYFRVPQEYIYTIHNGLPDSAVSNQAEGEETSILFPGRLTPIKQQVEFVKRTKGKLGPAIRIDFAGSGEDEIKLMEEIKGDIHYRYIGQINIHNHLPKYDYVCLFSQKEGLPLSLVEGCMYGKPLITNNILPVLDVNTNGYNGFVFPTWQTLVNGLNSLPKRQTPEYLRLSRNARARYEERFTEDVMIKKYKEYLQKVIENK